MMELRDEVRRAERRLEEARRAKPTRGDVKTTADGPSRGRRTSETSEISGGGEMR